MYALLVFSWCVLSEFSLQQTQRVQTQIYTAVVLLLAVWSHKKLSEWSNLNRMMSISLSPVSKRSEEQKIHRPMPFEREYGTSFLFFAVQANRALYTTNMIISYYSSGCVLHTSNWTVFMRKKNCEEKCVWGQIKIIGPPDILLLYLFKACGCVL